ncbi:DUF4041 domain-containing protein [Priestia megaterium]|uniref:DUF4041 domain-containing protein n=1 Tax=Priestia megaterium TaxID=1404 RepID=A0ABD4WSA1_PRIMG|nr:DUF4041 domain-containing protein [Priestia megaterium]MDD9783129.1 DUF4041 domain-containing protein [Priestia megaterium]
MHSIRWYYSTWFIVSLFAFWFLIIPLLIGLILVKKQKEIINSFYAEWKINKSAEFEDYKEQLIKEFNDKRDDLLSKEEKLLDSINHFKFEQENERKLFYFEREKERESIKEEYRKQKNKLQEEITFEKRRIITLGLLYQLKIVTLQKEIKAKEEQNSFLDKKIKRKHKQLKRLKRFYEQIKQKVLVLNDEILYQSFGLYDLRYDLETSEEYKEMLYKVRQTQKDAVKYDQATDYSVTWRLDDNLRKGEAMNRRNIKMTIRSFNNECDAIIHKVKFNNVEVAEKKIRTAREQLNKLNEYNSIVITDYYLDLKLEELYLVYEYALKVQEEKEEQKRLKELLREERKAQEELNQRLKIIQKDEQHFLNALRNYQRQLENVKEGYRYNLEKEIAKLQGQLRELQEEKEQLDYRLHHAKAGYVYIISNIGSFGENIFKIGMTRRLEPLDRVKELGDASVPFTFDIHAMIFSKDAPQLERSLHNAFQDKRVNKVNNRKEFFNVKLEEIKQVVYKNHNDVVEFIKVAEAREYRETCMIEKDEKAGSLMSSQ